MNEHQSEPSAYHYVPGSLSGSNKLAELQERLHSIDSNTELMHGEVQKIGSDVFAIDARLAEANKRIEHLCSQLVLTNEELEQVRGEADTVNMQLLQAQIDSQKRDDENAKAAKSAKRISYISIALAVISTIAAVAALFRG